MKKVSVFLFSFLFGLLLMVPAIHAANVDGVRLQLVSNQKTVSQGGNIQFHLLYTIPDTYLSTTGKIEVNVPEQLVVENAENSIWDESTNTLSWEVKDIGNNAGVLSFTLQTKADAAVGETFRFAAKAILGANVEVTTPEVLIEIGTEIHQPFFQGYPDGLFRPTSSLTRAEAAAIVTRIKNLTDDSELEAPYTDVSNDHWAYDYIKKVTNAGYMEGYNQKFHPDDPITRAELITLVLRLRGIEEIPLQLFPSINGHWAENTIGTAYSLGFLRNKIDSPILPNSYIPRDESAMLFDIAFFRGELIDGDIPVEQHFPDVTRNHWAFGWIEEASSVAHESTRSGMDESLIQYLPAETEPF